MKKILISGIIILLSLPVYSWEKSETIELIKGAETKLSIFDQENKGNSLYIPYKVYNDAVVNIVNSRSLLNNNEFDNAYYYASIAKVKIEAAIIIMKTRKMKYEMLKLERDYYKKHGVGKKEPASNNIIEANLLKKGQTYRRILTDMDIFKKRTFKLNKSGKNSLYLISRVLEEFPYSELRIVGHSSLYDAGKYTKIKAKKIAKYFISKGIIGARIKIKGVGNRIPMKTAVGYRRVNRVEILLLGIE